MTNEQLTTWASAHIQTDPNGFLTVSDALDAFHKANPTVAVPEAQMGRVLTSLYGSSKRTRRAGVQMRGYAGISFVPAASEPVRPELTAEDVEAFLAFIDSLPDAEPANEAKQ